MKIISENKKAKFEYFILESVDAGVVLYGSEVKSLRHGQINLTDNHVDIKDTTVVVYGLNIPTYEGANQFNHDPNRPKNLLMTKKQIEKFFGAVKKDGLTLVVTKIFFNDKGVIKATVGLCKGKKLYDKRDEIKKRDIARDIRRGE